MRQRGVVQHGEAKMYIWVNGERREVPPDFRAANLLDLLREAFGLTGARFGCGVGMCGACTVHVDGEAQRSCMLAVESLGNSRVTTIEGLAIEVDGRVAELHPVQRAWIEARVPQCGYCQSGQIMSAVALFESDSDADVDAYLRQLSGNLCRCGTYSRIVDALERIVARRGER